MIDIKAISSLLERLLLKTFGEHLRRLRERVSRLYLRTTHHKRSRAVLHNESTYPEPHMFNPERYLKDGKLDPSVADPEARIFGSGRRCEPRDDGFLCSTIPSTRY